MSSVELLLRGATVPGYGVRDVALRDGRIASVGERSAWPVETVETVDLTGYLLLPSAVEPHAHLDRALLGARVPNPTGDLAGAVRAIRSAAATTTYADVTARARKALGVAVARGYTAVRTHTDCRQPHAVRALVALRDAVADVVDVQVVAMAGRPLTGAAGREDRTLLAAALEAGADVVGGVPALDPYPERAVRELAGAAADAGRPLDLHVDETTDPGALTVRVLAREVSRCGLGGAATASHCVSLGQQDPATAADVAGELAAAGVAVVTLPQTNLYLQGRDAVTSVPRGLTALPALHAAGVRVAAGGDNWRDPFNPLGRIDPFETAALLVAAGHVDVGRAYSAVSADARAVLGLPPVTVAAGSPADLLAVRADSLADAVADATEDRVVVRAGRVVARTTVSREVRSW